MISKTTNVGDLVYIPSEVLMTDHKTFTKTKRPINVLFLGRDNIEVKVLYNGASWWVNKHKVYDVKGQK
jgi:hypothetical protein